MTESTGKDALESWNKLGRIAAEYSLKKWIFRGEEFEQWELKPKIGRPRTFVDLNGNSISYDDVKERETSGMNRYMREALPYLSIEPKSDLDWLSVAQHHGMPTKLLDWTESVFVAAYFAVKEGGFARVKKNNGSFQIARVDAAIYGNAMSRRRQ